MSSTLTWSSGVRNLLPNNITITRKRPKALTRDVWVSERITGMLDGNGS